MSFLWGSINIHSDVMNALRNWQGVYLCLCILERVEMATGGHAGNVIGNGTEKSIKENYMIRGLVFE